MRFSLESGAGTYTVSAYRIGAITINDNEIQRSIIVTADRIIDWPPQHFDELNPAHFQALLELELELVILGTGAQQHFPAPHLIRALRDQGIAVEAMNTGAACRTYNIVISEGRKAAAALLMI